MVALGSAKVGGVYIFYTLAMQIFEHEVRRWPLETFPHGVLYHIEDTFILILAVFHPKQAPEKWQERART
jgi:hypothetical protein